MVARAAKAPNAKPSSSPTRVWRTRPSPTILCDEDDVAGNHGATIGHVRPEQLFYLESRGVSSEDAEALFIRAKLEDAALSAPDERIRAAILRLGQPAH